MRIGTRTWIGGLLSVVMLGCLAGVVHARSASLLDGRVAVPSTANCIAAFGNGGVNANSGSVQNICPSAVQYLVGLFVDGNGGKSGFLTLRSPNTSATHCQVVATNPDGTGASGSNFIQNTIANVFQNITWNGVVVPGSGAMFVDCTVGPSAVLVKVDHN